MVSFERFFTALLSVLVILWDFYKKNLILWLTYLSCNTGRIPTNVLCFSVSVLVFFDRLKQCNMRRRWCRAVSLSSGVSVDSLVSLWLNRDHHCSFFNTAISFLTWFHHVTHIYCIWQCTKTIKLYGWTVDLTLPTDASISNTIHDANKQFRALKKSNPIIKHKIF